MGSKTTRERLRKHRQRDRFRSRIIWGGIVAVVLVLGGILIWRAIRPAAGVAIPIMPSSRHVLVGEDPGPFNSNPPTSGPHYDSPLTAGFYDQATAAEIGPYPTGYLVHNLEHGYIVFWYNCEILDEVGCTELKGQLQEVMSDARNIKVVAFPWDSIDFPVVATSWGRMQEFESFDTNLALRFVSSNRNRAPEPQAP
ncbi:MAG: DUF3105 domain-containing protein [Anaerolineales bacterium]